MHLNACYKKVAYMFICTSFCFSCLNLSIMYVSVQSSLLNHAGFSFSLLECVLGSHHCVMSLPLIQPTFPYFFLFFCVYTLECESEDKLQGKGKGFSLSDPSLPFIIRPLSPSAHFRLLLTLSLTPSLFLPLLSMHLQFHSKTLMIVYWPVFQVQIT